MNSDENIACIYGIVVGLLAYWLLDHIIIIVN